MNELVGKNLSTIHPTIVVDDAIRKALAKSKDQEIPFSDYEVEQFVKETIHRLFVVLEERYDNENN